MPNYRRLFVPGGCWFFTVNLQNRSSHLLVEHIDELQRVIQRTQRRRPFHLAAWVVLPNHLHAIWSLPPNDTDFPSRWRDIKVEFSKAMPKGEPVSSTRTRRGERGIWQRGYWEHFIRDDRDYTHHMDYCWFNPVKHGLVERVEDWPHSSYHDDTTDRPKSGDLERTLADCARRHGNRGYGERDP